MAADQRLATQPPTVDLPPELHALRDFLDPDTRPTVIFRDSYDGSQELVYGNAAFARWQRQWKRTSSASPPTSEYKLGNGHAPHEVKSETLQDDGWEVRISGDFHIVVATALHEEVADLKAVEPPPPPPTAEPAPRLLTPPPPPPPSHGDDVSSPQNGRVSAAAPAAKQSLDWTAGSVPDMSPWIEFMRSFDWASTGLGTMETWSPVLRQQMLSIMANPNPRTIIWGEGMTFIYNEACVQLFGSKHPEFMGVNARVAWASVWAEAGPLINAAYNGRATSATDLYLTLDRSGFLEETYWNITSLPILSHQGPAVGALSELTETTLLVTGERRRKALDQINKGISQASTLQELWPGIMKGLEATGVDFPFCMMYAVVDDVPDDNDTDAVTEDSYSSNYPKKCVLVGSVGVASDHPDAVQSFPLSDQSEGGPGLIATLYEVWKTRKTVKICPDDGTLPLQLASAVPGRSFGDAIRKALVSPVSAAGCSDVLAVLVAAINPRCSMNSEYNLFIHLAVDIVEKAVALISLPQEQRRAQKIADDINNALAQQLRLTTLQAERSEARFSRLADTAPTGMYMFAGDGRMLYVNDSYLRLFGQTREEAATKQFEVNDWKDIVHEDDLERFLASWKQINEQKSPVTVEYRLNRPYRSVDKSTGQEIAGETWMLANAFPELEADGKVATIQGWLTDISHRKFSENLMAQRLEDALETKRQSENFIDMTSHEMRNPLSAILQSADSIVSTLTPSSLPMQGNDMIVTPNVAEEVMDAAQTIILCAQHQKRIVDDILTLSKLDASLLVIAPDKVQPPTLVSRALKMYEAEINRAGITAKMCVEPAYHELKVDWVVLDPSRLLQVIINLLTNAIKFTQYSDTRHITVCLGASLERPTGKHHGISFIPPRHVRNPHRSQTEWGLGEDIYIQFAVIDTGRGLSDDEMKLLFQRFQQASPKTYKQYGGSGLGLFISRELCELQGGQIGVASANGTTTFTFFVRAKRWLPEDERLAPTKPPFGRIASAPASSNVLSLQANSSLTPEASNVFSQFDDSLVAAADFVRSSSIERMPSMPNLLGVVGENVKPAPSELHVLIVEDNLINQKVMSQQLRKAGCTVHVANHGGECLSFLQSSTFCAAPTPLSIILLDLEMPIMDGLTCIRHIRQRQLSGEISRHVPVIAVTANARSEQISVAIEAGMDQVITKPFRIAELMPQMRSLVAGVAQLKAKVLRG